MLTGTGCRPSRCASLVLLGVLVLAHPAQALTINVTYDNSITSLGNAATVEADFNSVIASFDSVITNNVTVNIDVGWGNYGAQSVGSSVSASSVNTVTSTFSAVKSLLAVTGATLPPTNTVYPNTFLIPDAEAKALGVTGISATYDGYIGFSNTLTFGFDESSIAAGAYDFKAAAKHEIEEVLGRTSYLNSGTNFFGTPVDLYRYSAPGTNSFTYNTPNGVTPAYASTDGGVTSLGTFNDSSSGGDRFDWQSPGNTTDAQNAALPTGTVLGLSISDMKVLKALGYTFGSNVSSLFSAANAPYGASPGSQSLTPAPEPASVSVVMVGLGALGVLRRRRRVRG